MQHGFIKVAAASPRIRVADPNYNAQEILRVVQKCAEKKAKLIVLPQLCLTGATCQDLFFQELLIRESKKALQWLAQKTDSLDALIFVGLPWKKGNQLYNTAAVLNQGKVLALIPQTCISASAETGGSRYFAKPEEETVTVSDFGYEIPFGTRVLLQMEEMHELVIGCELGEDFFSLHSPAAKQAAAGAVVIVHLSSFSEEATAGEWQQKAAEVQSRILTSGYILSGAGEGESTQDMVFAGRKMVAENGRLLAVDSGENEILCQDIDIFRLLQERNRRSEFGNAQGAYTKVFFHTRKEACCLERQFSSLPFIPENAEERKHRMENIFAIQAKGLKKRLAHTGCGHAVLGLSGGLDSTLALLVTVRAFDMLGLPREQIRTVTMPCFGTTDRTYENACQLAAILGTQLEEVDIKEAVLLHFRDIRQEKQKQDVTYENSQARERTQVLMDIANRDGGMVIGTGDMSELALGWATYNGDHMSMYGVNAGVPKTLVRHLVLHYAESCGEEELKKILLDVLDTPVSPELLPPVAGVTSQKTEDLVGPYELHDFFLYYMLRFGFSPDKIYRMAVDAFAETYKKAEIAKWLRIFCRRFFAQQYKRSCLPDGPKTGSVSLSPRGDLRMPSDAAADLWLKQLEVLE